jgi:hypothetical protein
MKATSTISKLFPFTEMQMKEFYQDENKKNQEVDKLKRDLEVYLEEVDDTKKSMKKDILIAEFKRQTITNKLIVKGIYNDIPVFRFDDSRYKLQLIINADTLELEEYGEMPHQNIDNNNLFGSLNLDKGRVVILNADNFNIYLNEKPEIFTTYTGIRYDVPPKTELFNDETELPELIHYHLFGDKSDLQVCTFDVSIIDVENMLQTWIDAHPEWQKTEETSEEEADVNISEYLKVVNQEVEYSEVG